MCTSRYRSRFSPRRVLVFLAMVLCGLAAFSCPERVQAEPPDPLAPVMAPAAVERFRNWLTGDDPLLVLFVVDGLRADRVSRSNWHGEPLMPRLNALSKQALQYRNCFSECTVSGTDLFCLLAGLSPLDHFQEAQGGSLQVDSGFGALPAAGFETFSLLPAQGLPYHDGLMRMPWLWPTSRQDAAAQRPDFLARADSVLTRISAQGQPTLLLVFSDALVPPYLECDDFLTRTDPEPWSGGSAKVGMEAHRAKRMKIAHNRGTPSSRARMLEANWLLDAAHAATDSLLGCLVDRLEQENLWRRTCLVVTSPRGMVVDHREDYGPVGLGPGQIRVPLVVRLPDGIGEPRCVEAPVVLGDLAATFARHLRTDGKTAPGRVDLMGVVPVERARWSVAWSEGYDEYHASDWSGLRLTTPDFSVVVEADGSRRLFDPRLDPDEFEDLASREPAALEQVQKLLCDEIYGEQRDVWIYIKGSGESERLTGSVRTSTPVMEWEGLDLEDGDVVTGRDSSLDLSLNIEEPGDLIRLRTSGLDPGFSLGLEVYGERGLWPVFVGKSATVYDGSDLELKQHGEGLLRAIVQDSGAGIVEWADEQEGGVYIWVVPVRD